MPLYVNQLQLQNYSLNLLYAENAKSRRTRTFFTVNFLSWAAVNHDSNNNSWVAKRAIFTLKTVAVSQSVKNFGLLRAKCQAALNFWLAIEAFNHANKRYKNHASPLYQTPPIETSLPRNQDKVPGAITAGQ